MRGVRIMDLLAYINPFTVYRNFVSRPIESFVTEKFTSYKKKTNDSLSSVKELLTRAGVILVFFSTVLLISILMYVIFYYIYMPNVTHVQPVHLQYKSCDENMGVCSFPSAHVQLTRRSQMLMSSQPYRVKLVMEVPETQMNKDLGMFMVCAQMRAAGGALVSSSCRSAMLRHRSNLHHTFRTLVYAPLLVSGLNEENQLIDVELNSDFQDDQTHPVTDAYVELQSRFVQVLSCELHIEAHFTGLRYVMYYWPKISALIGICSNLFIVSWMFILSWNHLHDGLPDNNARNFEIEIENEKIEEKTTPSGKVKLAQEDYFPIFQEESLLKFKMLEMKKNCTNFFFVSLIFILNWYNLQFGLPDYIKSKLEWIGIKNEKSEDEGKPNVIVKLEREETFTFVEEVSVLEEFQNLEKNENKDCCDNNS